MLRRYWPISIAWLAFAARLIPTPRTVDDAFITFRYARNIVDGIGFVYNAGERVLGTTTPLYTLLMAALSALSGWRDFPWMALWVNALADAAVCLVLLRLGRKLSGRRAVGAAAAVLWAIAPMSVAFAIGGMETSVFILLLTLMADLYLSGRTRWAAFTAGLLLLTRPDGVLLVAPIVFDQLIRAWRERRWPWAEAAIFIGTGLPWAIFATLYFGSPIPNSVAAKSEAYLLPPASALVRLLQHYSTPFFENDLIGSFWQLWGVFVYLFLCLVASLAAFRRDTRTWPIALYPWLYLVVFAAANPLIFRWYLTPPLPFYFLLILTGISQLGEGIGSRLKLSAVSSHAKRSAIALLPSVFFFFSLLNGWTLKPDHGPQRPAPSMAWHQLELIYEDVGRELAGRVTPQATVIAAGDIGALGYYSGARILDTVGLISPETAAYFPLDPDLYTSISYAIPPQLIVDEQPDFVVLLETYGRKGLLRDARFHSAYALYKKIPTTIYDSDGMLIYERAAP